MCGVNPAELSVREIGKHFERVKEDDVVSCLVYPTRLSPPVIAFYNSDVVEINNKIGFLSMEMQIIVSEGEIDYFPAKTG